MQKLLAHQFCLYIGDIRKYLHNNLEYSILFTLHDNKLEFAKFYLDIFILI